MDRRDFAEIRFQGAGGLALWQQQRLVAYVEANVGSNICVADLARVARLSTGHFFKAFRQSFGETPLAYLTKQRIQRSQALIMSSQATLAQIAAECGMSDQAHFTRVFRRIVGIPPGLWRRQFGPGPTSGSNAKHNPASGMSVYAHITGLKHGL